MIENNESKHAMVIESNKDKHDIVTENLKGKHDSVSVTYTCLHLAFQAKCRLLVNENIFPMSSFGHSEAVLTLESSISRISLLCFFMSN